MTCIVGIVSGKRVIMGGDSAAMSDHDVSIRQDAKIFQTGKFLFGGAGSFRMIQLMRYQFRPPAIEAELHEYMCTVFIETVRNLMMEAGCSQIANNVHTIDGSLLVAYGNRLFEIHGDFQVGETTTGFTSIGIGAPYAIGALCAFPVTLPAKTRAIKALEIAAENTVGVRPPFTIAST